MKILIKLWFSLMQAMGQMEQTAPKSEDTGLDQGNNINVVLLPQ